MKSEKKHPWCGYIYQTKLAILYVQVYMKSEKKTSLVWLYIPD